MVKTKGFLRGHWTDEAVRVWKSGDWACAIAEGVNGADVNNVGNLEIEPTDEWELIMTGHGGPV